MTIINICVKMTLNNYYILKKIEEDFNCQFNYNSVNDFTEWLTIKCKDKDIRAIEKRLKQLTYNDEEE